MLSTWIRRFTKDDDSANISKNMGGYNFALQTMNLCKWKIILIEEGYLAVKYTHIIWDWNGTLLNDIDLAIECMNNMLKKRNMRLINKDYYKTIVNIPIIEYYKALGFDFSKEKFEDLACEFLHEFDSRISECALHQCSIDILGLLKRNGVSQSILSATAKDTLDKALKQYNIFDLFDYVIGQDNHLAGSKVEKGRALIEKLGIDSRKVLLIGDITHDFEVAESIKCDAILVSHGHHSEERLKTKNCLVINSLEKLMDVV